MYQKPYLARTEGAFLVRIWGHFLFIVFIEEIKEWEWHLPLKSKGQGLVKFAGGFLSKYEGIASFIMFIDTN